MSMPDESSLSPTLRRVLIVVRKVVAEGRPLTKFIVGRRCMCSVAWAEDRLNELASLGFTWEAPVASEPSELLRPVSADGPSSGEPIRPAHRLPSAEFEAAIAAARVTRAERLARQYGGPPVVVDPNGPRAETAAEVCERLRKEWRRTR